MNKKKEYQKLKEPAKLTEIKTIEGELKSKVTKENEAAAESIKNYVNLNEVLIKKLCK
jgi:hypothetical protein